MLGHLIYNYEHLDDLRIQEEISKSVYAKTFQGVNLVHTYNGKKLLWPRPYLEDKLILLKNRGHYKGASDLINAGLKYFTQTKIKGLKYVLVTAADTWILKSNFLRAIIAEMEQKGRFLAASSWGRVEPFNKPHGFSTDLFVIDIEWNRKAKLFPVDYDGFVKKFSDFFALQYGIPILEVAVQYNFQKYFISHFENNDMWRKRNQAFRRIFEREPVHSQKGVRFNAWPKIGLYTSPTPQVKQEALKKMKADFGPYTLKLIQAKNLSYYNNAV
jgi:hypothetical protein